MMMLMMMIWSDVSLKVGPADDIPLMEPPPHDPGTLLDGNGLPNEHYRDSYTFIIIQGEEYERVELGE